MHEWFKSRLEWGVPQPPMKELWKTASHRVPLSEWRGEIYDALACKEYDNSVKFRAHMVDGVECILFGMYNGKPDYDVAIIVLSEKERCDLEWERSELEDRIDEINRLLGRD